MNQLKKILCLTTVYPRDKDDYYGNWIRDLLQEFAKNSYSSIVLCPHYKDIKEEEVHGLVRIKRFRYFFNNFEVMGYGRFLPHEWAKTKFQQYMLTIRNVFLLVPYLMSMFFNLLFLAVKEKPSILFVHLTIPCAPIGLIVSKLTGIPAVLKIYGTDIVISRRLHLKWFAKFIHNRYPKIVSNSTYTRGLSVGLGIRNPNKVRAIPEGIYPPAKIPKSKIEAIRRKYGLKKNKCVLTVHRLVPLKGTPFFIKAAAEVLKKYPNVKFLIGGEGPQKENLKKLIKKLGVEKNVLLLGRIPVVEEYIAACNMYVMSSTKDKWGNTEGLGMPVVVANSFGKPSIGFKVGGPMDTIVDSKTGYLVEDRNWKQMADRILDLLKDDKKRKQYGKNALKYFNEKFIWSKVYEDYKEFFGI